jgi:DNA-directed RNA polymerase subunit RPC12/RpoP
MNVVCPECKNSLDLSTYPSLKEKDVIECATCGITLVVKNMNDEEIDVEVTDEGK